MLNRRYHKCYAIAGCPVIREIKLSNLQAIGESLKLETLESEIISEITRLVTPFMKQRSTSKTLRKLLCRLNFIGIKFSLHPARSAKKDSLCSFVVYKRQKIFPNKL